MKKTMVVVAALAASLALTACGPAASSPETVQAAADAKMAPSFVLQDAQGQEVSLEALRGKVVLLNFWATWCGPCKIEMPWFVEFQRKYRDQGFSVVAVSMDEDGWEVVRPYTEQLELNFPVVVGDDEVADSFGGVDALPTTFIIDREGRVAASHMGLVSKDEIETELKNLL